MNELTFKDLADKYTRPAKVIREAHSQQARARLCARRKIEKIEEEKGINDFTVESELDRLLSEVGL